MSININVNNNWKEASGSYCKVNGVWRKVNKICKNIGGEWKCTRVNAGINPDEAPNGIYIGSNDGLLYTLDMWNTSNNINAVGVAIISDNCKFIIDKENEATKMNWSNQRKDLSLSNITSDNDAIADYNGKKNTDIIMSEDNQNVAASYCRNKSITFGTTRQGYLGAAGEWYIIYNNRQLINTVLSTIGGHKFIGFVHLTSTEVRADSVWYIQNGTFVYAFKDNPAYDVRPLYEL